MPAEVFGPDVNTAVVLWYNQFLPGRIVQMPRGDRINMADPPTWSSWSASAASNVTTYDLGSVMELDSIGIAAHNFASRAVAYRISYSPDGVAWGWHKSFETPTTDEDIFRVFPVVSARYWRLEILGSGSNVGIFFGGRTLRFPHAPLDGYKPLHHARKYTKLFNDSIKGQFLGNRVLASGAETDVDMGFLDRTWVENNIRGFEKHYNTGGTFFYAGCPSKYPLDMGYCRAAGDDSVVEIEWTERDKMATVAFGVQSYVG